MNNCLPVVHVPVLAEEVIRHVILKKNGVYVDATLGLGGHAERILQAVGPAGRVIGFEWDEQAADFAAARLREFGGRIRIIRRSYAELAEGLKEEKMERIDGLLLVLGDSFLQLDRGGLRIFLLVLLAARFAGAVKTCARHNQ